MFKVAFADGNQMMEYDTRRAKIETTSVAAENSLLGYMETKQLLEQRLLSKTKYGLTLSQFIHTQCHQLSLPINKASLPKMHINRNMPRAVVYCPKCWGGLGSRT
eukprot:scaffold129293_cov46-Cyclotella_meneghiniana.AAC.1